MARPRTRPAQPTLAGQRIKELRENAGLSQHALAKLSGVSRATIAALELGRYQGAMARTLEKLAATLDISFNQLHDNDATMHQALDKFQRSPWFGAVQVSSHEQSWLARTPKHLWDDLAVSNQAFAELLAWRRRHKRSG